MEGLEVALHGYRMKPLEKGFDVIYRSIDISLSRHNDILAERTLNGNASNGNALHGIAANGHFKSEFGECANRSTTKESDILIFDYLRGKEMEVQHKIAHRDALQPLSLFFVSADSLDGDAAQGFARSLRKEYPVWTIYVAAFDHSWTQKQRIHAAMELTEMKTTELEMRVDADGSISVPRIQPSDTPIQTTPLDLTKPWTIDGSQVAQVSLPYPVPQDHVVVHVDQVDRHHSNPWTFIGTSDTYSRPVVGISVGAIASHLVVHEDSLAEVDQDLLQDNAGVAILAVTLVVLAVGTHTFSRPNRLVGKRVVVVEHDCELRDEIEQVCCSLRMSSLSVTTLSRDDLESCYHLKPQYILSGTHDPATINILRSLVAPGGRLLLWNHPDCGIESIAVSAPAELGEALKHAATYRINSSPAYVPITSLLPDLSYLTIRAPSLFDPEKAYLLIGGIGSLGMHMALWMYEVRPPFVFMSLFSRYGAARCS